MWLSVIAGRGSARVRSAPSWLFRSWFQSDAASARPADAWIGSRSVALIVPSWDRMSQRSWGISSPHHRVRSRCARVSSPGLPAVLVRAEVANLSAAFVISTRHQVAQGGRSRLYRSASGNADQPAEAGEDDDKAIYAEVRTDRLGHVIESKPGRCSRVLEVLSTKSDPSRATSTRGRDSTPRPLSSSNVMCTGSHRQQDRFGLWHTLTTSSKGSPTPRYEHR
jgi:hypothetical protein